MRIVIVEDEAPIREGLAKILHRINPDYELAGKADNGKAGYDLIRRMEPDLVILDIQMPKMNGYETTAAIRRLPRADAKSVPIYAMTASAFSEDRKKSLECGMNGHINKPVEPEDIYNTMKEAVYQDDK